MALLGWAVTGTCAAFLAGVVSLLGWRDLAWRIRQRRRRHTPIDFGGRRL
jgi:hypothetical protein